MNCLVIKTTNERNGQHIASVPLSNIPTKPRQLLSGNFGFGSGGRAGQSTGGNADPTTQTIEGASLNVLRRGSEFVADSIVRALGGIASLISVLQSYSQNGEAQISGLGSSAQELTNRLFNMGVNAASTLLQRLSDEISSPSSTTISYRPSESSLFLSANTPQIQTSDRPFGLQSSGIFGRFTNVEPENLTDVTSHNTESTATQLSAGIRAIESIPLHFANPRIHRQGRFTDFGFQNPITTINENLRLTSSQIQSGLQSGLGTVRRTASRFKVTEGISNFNDGNLSEVPHQGMGILSDQLQSGISTANRLSTTASNLVHSLISPEDNISTDTKSEQNAEKSDVSETPLTFTAQLVNSAIPSAQVSSRASSKESNNSNFDRN